MTKWKKQNGFKMKKSELKDKFELLEIQLKHLENDYILTKEEYEKSAEKHLEILFELKESNQRLQNFQKNLEKIIEEQTKELKESEEKFRTFMETASDLMYIIDKDGDFTYVNESMVRTLGYSKEEMNGMGVTQILSKEEVEKNFKSRFEELIKKGKIIFEDIWLPKDGKEIYGEVKVVAIYDSNSKYAGARGVLRDITERKKAEESLRESEKFNSSLLDNSPNPIIVINQDTSVKYVNPALKKLTGFSSEELIGVKAPYPWWTKETLKKTNKDLEKAMREGAQRLEETFQNKTGERFCVEITSVPIKSDGELKYYIANWVDITERKQVEKNLWESEKKYREFLETLPDLVYELRIFRPDVTKVEKEKILNYIEKIRVASEEMLEEVVKKVIKELSPFLDGTITYANKRTFEILGYSPDRLGNIKVYDVIAPEHIEFSLINVMKIIAQKSPKSLEHNLIKADGERIYVSINVNLEEEFPFIVKGIARDITERKQLEEQLQIRQRMDSLGTLVGGIAHDFNNILSGIMGYIDMLNLEADGFTEIQKGYLQNAAKGCDRAADLIRKFQTLSKITLPEKERVDVYEIVKEVFSILKETTDRLIKKKIDLKQGNYYVQADPSEFHQVLMNLGTNAVHAIEERGVKKGDYIKVTAEEYRIEGFDKTGLPEGEYIHIIFKDNGIGMSDEIRKKAFDPLFTTRKKGKKRGQGLGLAIVYNIVTRIHNGYIEIKSKEGKGTTFHIYLPKSQSKKEAKTKEVIGIMGGTETILVVDDEEIVLSLAETILKKYGYKVLTAVDGEKSLDIYKEKVGSIDAVILDLTMPEMSGKMVLERMLEISPDVKIIISSGHSEKYAREGILSLAKGYVKKPYKLSDLAQTVRVVLDL